MGAHFSYLLSTLLFTGTPTIVIVVFFYRLIRPRAHLIAKLTLIFLLMTPIVERIAFMTNAWQFARDKNLGIYILGDYLETLIVTFFITVAVSSMTIIWSHYVDRGEKPFLSAARDCFNGRYLPKFLLK